MKQLTITFNKTIPESDCSTGEITESCFLHAFILTVLVVCVVLASFTAKSLNLGYISVSSKSALRSSGLMNTNESQRHILIAFT